MADSWHPILPCSMRSVLSKSLDALVCGCGCSDYAHAANANADSDAALQDCHLPKRAAVMIMIYGIAGMPAANGRLSEKKHPTVILTSKSQHLRKHAGEISFPGGKAERRDKTLLDTAIRETQEELGLFVPRQSVLGRLLCVRTRNTGYVIAPFVAMLGVDAPHMRPNHEVDEILEVPLYDLLGTMRHDDDPLHCPEPGMCSFDFGDYCGRTVWGATAQMLRQMHDILSN